MDTVYIELNSDMSEVAKVEEILRKLNDRIGFEEEKFINLQIAVSEALVNAIVHGNMESPAKKVHIIINHDKDMVEVKVKDEGGGFDISTLPDPTNEENLMKESGRGVFIIMSLVDEFNVNSDSKGTEMSLVIRKNKNK